MGAVASFSYDTWVRRYPEFGGVDRNLVGDYFNEATIYHSNDGSGPVRKEMTQLLLLGMVTAHICKMNAPVEGKKASDLVGRINSASEGSVSVSAENSYPPGSPQWFQQTKYGSAYWAATRQYRTARYFANPGRFSGNPFGY